MDDDLATDAQVARMADGVRRRIDARRARSRARRRAVLGVVVTVLVLAGGLGLLRTQLATYSGASSGAGGSAADRPAAASPAGAAPDVVCHAGSTLGSRSSTVEVSGAPSARSAVRACAALRTMELRAGSSGAPASSASPAPSDTRDLLACRDGAGRLQVLVRDAHPGTQCVRNRLQQP